ncbi:MAG: HD domain-containing protein [Erysipelotrichales bacterium]|nr:HD domain-containing protein [Erysipelotrichales bacterium]
MRKLPPVNEALFEIYTDEVPGLLRELAHTPALARLKDVGMNCGLEYTSFPLYCDLKPYSRYDHSVGVAYIIWHFTRDIRQALAGLFHDISTPVFAHVVDFLNGDHLTQESTEEKTEKMIRESKEIMAVLDREGISVAEVADYHQYPVADNPSGRLSADRLEYTLGNFLNFHTGTLEDCVRFYRDLTVGTNEYGEPELVFHDLENARSFAEKALVNSVIYSQDEDRYAMEYLAGILRKAMNRRVLYYEDLWTTEPEVIARLKSDPEILREWEKFGGFSRVEKSAEKQTGDGWLKIDAKRRYIDPYTEGYGRISEGLAEMKEKIDGYRNLSYDYYLKGY